MPPKENPERACEECIHFFACSKQCGVPMAQGSATGCECYETVKSSTAACLIERLTAENAALREKVPQWISVEDRLPSPGARVLITDGVFVGEGFLAGKAFLGRGEGTSWKRYSNIPWDKSMKTEITHWMPLPGAPEAHNGKENS